MSRENNQGSWAAKFLLDKITQNGYSAQLLDPDVLDLPLLKKPCEDVNDAPKILQDSLKIIKEADAFVVFCGRQH